MCDYSLMGVPSRLAKEREPLQLHRFPTGSLGLASPVQLQKQATPEQGVSHWWQRVKDWFREEPITAVVAVCIPPGAQLTLHGIPSSLQREFGVGAVEKVTFTQLNATPHSYRDAIRFKDGRTVLLQRLNPGQKVEVLTLDLVEEYELPIIAEHSTMHSHA